MADHFQEQLRLREGEELVASMDVSPASHLDLTNQRVIVWQRSGSLERVTPIKLSDITGVELVEERNPLWHLIGAVVLSVAGAPLLAYLVESLTSEMRLLSVALGVVGIAMVVAGLVMLSAYLRGVLFPSMHLVFHGAPELRVNISPEASRAARELIQHIYNLKRPPTLV